MTTKPVTPRPAATVTLVRDASPGFEVLMLQRSHKAGFMASVYVFPGGGVDRADHSPEAQALCGGLTDDVASRRLSIEKGGIAYWVATIRESFEEAGLLLACDASGDLIALDDPQVARRFDDYRHAMHEGKETFTGMCRKEGLHLAVDRIAYMSHWITPVSAPKRFDTRFFVAVAPERQTSLQDDRETIDQLWIRPQEALERGQRGEIELRTPTIKTLETLAESPTTADLMRAMQAPRHIPTILPVATKGGGRLMPGDPGYEQAAKQEPPPWK